MPFIVPTNERLQQLQAEAYKGPIVMVNLLKFKPDGGAALYEKYYRAVTKLALGRLITGTAFLGTGLMPVIGDEEWDEVILVEYPSIAAFLEMLQNKEYQTYAQWRSESLLDSRLYCTVPKDKSVPETE